MCIIRLNADYKIIEKAIALRLQSVLPKIINDDQAGFMKKRRASSCVRKLIDLIDFCKNTGTDAFHLCLDYQKAFDRPELTSIEHSLKFFDIPKKITEWIKILYRGFTVRIQNTGHMSEPVNIERSVHQGGCSSAFLFNILAEALAIQIRSNKKICGINTGEHTHILNQFADNTNATGKADQENLNELLEEFERFHKHSGLLINYDKTALYRINTQNLPQLYTRKQIAWETEGINVLGIYITEGDIVPLNYDPTIEKVKSTLDLWSQRDLTLIGRIRIINTLTASLFVHKMQVLPFLDETRIKKIENYYSDFIWKGKRSKIPLKVLKLPKGKGGLNLVDLRKRDIALKILWLQTLQEDNKCRELTMKLLSPVLDMDIFKCNLHHTDIKALNIKSTFWRDMLHAWSVYNYTDSADGDSQMIWLNSHLRIGEKPFLNAAAYKKGLVWISQLYPNGRLIGVK